ncbi:ATP-binding protein [Myxococcota bacterium]|nr:ATP-binding protein [Myxococcota bacterium]
MTATEGTEAISLVLDALELEGFVASAVSGEIESASRRALATLGASAGGERPRWADCVVPEDRLEFEAAFRRAVATGDGLACVHRVAGGGSVREVLAWLQPLGAVGGVLRVAVVVVEIPRPGARFEALPREPLRGGEGAGGGGPSETRTPDPREGALLALLAHELRNPLSAITNAVRVLERRGLSDPLVARQVGVIGRQSRHLAGLVEDLLDFSRIAADKLPLAPREVDLADLLARCVEARRPGAEERRHSLSMDLGPDPLAICGDPRRLAQVFDNLLDNALKYTPPGGHVRIWARREGDQVVVGVRDDGIGIDPGLLPRVFDPFCQGEAGVARPVGGLGLGLALVRSLVRNHGGDVEATSAGPGQGAEFVVRLPAVDPGPIEASSRGDSFLGVGCRVLLVEDQPDAREALRDLLQIQGYDVEVAADGEEAVERAAVRRSDVALVDIGLPGVDGYEVARRLRGMHREAPITLVALSGFGGGDVRRRAREAGFDAHLVKPVDPGELDRLLRRAATFPSLRERSQPQSLPP